MIDYSFVLKLSSWSSFEVACFLRELNPEDFGIGHCSNGTKRYSSRNSSITKSIIVSIEKDILIFDMWYMQNKSPMSWIEELIREDYEIPSLLWQAFKRKFPRDCEYNKDLPSLHPAIMKKINIDRLDPKPEIKAQAIIDTQLHSQNKNKGIRRKCELLLNYVEQYVRQGMTCDQYIKMMKDKKYIDEGQKFIPSSSNTDNTNSGVRHVYLKLARTKNGLRKYDIHYQRFNENNGGNTLGDLNKKSQKKLREYFKHARKHRKDIKST